MAKSKSISVKESEVELKKLLRQQPIHLRNRVQMLLVLKRSERSLSKNELSNILKINHNTAQRWRKTYCEKGIDALLSDGRVMVGLVLNHQLSARRCTKLLNKD